MLLNDSTPLISAAIMLGFGQLRQTRKYGISKGIIEVESIDWSQIHRTETQMRLKIRVIRTYERNVQ
jgi:hypothetical protein